MCIHTHIYIYTTHIHIHTYTYIHTYSHTHTHTHIYIYIYIYTHIQIHVDIYPCIRINIHKPRMYTPVYIHTRFKFGPSNHILILLGHVYNNSPEMIFIYFYDCFACIGNMHNTIKYMLNKRIPCIHITHIHTYCIQ